MSDLENTAPTSPAPKTTQQRYPWKATLRTGLAVIIGAATAVPVVATILDDELSGWELATPLGQTVIVASIVTRIMAAPVVDRALSHVGLGSAPAPKPETGDPGPAIV